MNPAKPQITHLSKREFKEKVFDYTFGKEWNYKGDMPSVIDFYADWCAPCKMVAPVLEELSQEYSGKIKVYKVNTEKEPEISKAFGISSIPTILFIGMEGKPVIVRGAQQKKMLKNNIEKILQKEVKAQKRRFSFFNW
jgi:thioredoxin 1